MKKIYTLVLITIFISCEEPKYTYIGQKIIDGKISATEPGKKGSYGSPAFLPKIWVQTETSTTEINIPFEYERRWKVGDSCLLIIEKYKENETK
jgi:hypothetical protein